LRVFWLLARRVFVKFKAKKSLHLCRLFPIWLHDLDSNQGPSD